MRPKATSAAVESQRFRTQGHLSASLPSLLGLLRRFSPWWSLPLGSPLNPVRRYHCLIKCAARAACNLVEKRAKMPVAPDSGRSGFAPKVADGDLSWRQDRGCACSLFHAASSALETSDLVVDILWRTRRER